MYIQISLLLLAKVFILPSFTSSVYFPLPSDVPVSLPIP